VAILASVPFETAVALGELRRKGIAVTAVVNMFDDEKFGQASALLRPKASRPGS